MLRVLPGLKAEKPSTGSGQAQARLRARLRASRVVMGRRPGQPGNPRLKIEM